MTSMFITFEGVEGSGKSTQVARLAAHLRAAGRAARATREPGGTPLADAMRVLLLHPDAAQRALAAADLIPGPAAPLEAAAPALDAAPVPVPATELATVEPEPEPVYPVTELFLLSAARVQHVARIRAWLAAGEVVVCDRFADATLAYQGYGRGLDLATVRDVERLATGGLAPDLTLLLDLPPSEGQRRKQPARARSLGQLQLFDTSAASAPGSEWNRLDEEALPFHQRVRDGYLALAAAEPDRWAVLDAALPPDALEAAVWAVVAPRLTTP
jgi:dTMP kinase